MNKPCEICGRALGNESPFKDDAGRQYQSVCGGCKIKMVLTPERVASLEREIAAAVRSFGDDAVIKVVKP